MNRFNDLKQNLQAITADLGDVFAQLTSIPDMDPRLFEDWESTCGRIQRQLEEEVFRIAVVGAIKSGKSTFINSLLKGDLLKRGAGVITSIVTRVRSGRYTNAKLFLKSWDDVNTEIEQATALFPNLSWRSENRDFDIRRESDRTALSDALAQLTTDHLITSDSRDANSVLLASYVRGYNDMKDLIGPEPTTFEIPGGRFHEHRQFVANDYLSVYMKDIELDIEGIDLDRNIEIADCQGGDSPNPIHLSMIQDYLLLTHLIVYVVSSRTGLRQADIKLLNIIKKMGILHNILFVVNSDFSDHDTLANLETLVGKVGEEIGLIKSGPEVYTFSALFNLFREHPNDLSEKDRQRLDQWEQDRPMVTYSDSESERFAEAFQHKLSEERLSLLLTNNVERIAVIVDGLGDWIRVNNDILGRDATGAAEVIEKINRHKKLMGQIRSMINSTLRGTTQKIQKEIKTDVDRFFDPRSTAIVGSIQDFIHGYRLNFSDYEENLINAGFSSTMYLVFQEFRQALNTYLAESVNPEVIRFIREEEEKIKDALETVAEPYDAMIRDAVLEHDQSMAGVGISLSARERQTITLPDMETIRNLAGLALPPAGTQMRYSAKIRTEAVMRLGVYKIAKVVKKIFKKPLRNEREEALLALRDGFQRIKRETERSILFHFKDYKENIKFQFLMKLIDATSGHLQEALTDRFQAYATDSSSMVNLVHKEQSEKQHTLDILKDLDQQATEISAALTDLRSEIEPSWGNAYNPDPTDRRDGTWQQMKPESSL